MVTWLCGHTEMLTSEAGLSAGVVNQQRGQEAQDVFPVDLVCFQDLLQVMKELLRAEGHGHLRHNMRGADKKTNISREEVTFPKSLSRT